MSSYNLEFVVFKIMLLNLSVDVLFSYHSAFKKTCMLTVTASKQQKRNNTQLHIISLSRNGNVI